MPSVLLTHQIRYAEQNIDESRFADTCVATNKYAEFGLRIDFVFVDC